MFRDMISNYDKNIVLPQWLDDFIYQDLAANYCCAKCDMVVLDWTGPQILSYLGTYFPRSYAEAYCIFSTYIADNVSKYDGKERISIFDFGCGTGGELVGLIMAISEQLPHIKEIEIGALDGNQYALRLLERIVDKTSDVLGCNISKRIIPMAIDDLYDMDVTMEILSQQYDFIITFKAVCEFVTRQQFEEKNPYEYLLRMFVPKLTSTGIVCIADITTYNDVSSEWLPNMLEQASQASDVKIVDKNMGYNEKYYVSHSMKQNDMSKIAWRIYTCTTK